MSKTALVAFVEGRSDEIFFPEVLRRLVKSISGPAPQLQLDVHVEVLRNGEVTRGTWVLDRVQHYFAFADVVVIHVDGSANRARELRKSYAPVHDAWARSHNRATMLPLVPVKETEAWVLSDLDVLREVIGAPWDPSAVTQAELLRSPERLADPKRTLADVVMHARRPRRRPRSIDAVLPQISQLLPLTSLRRLPSFRSFEADLINALTMNAEESP